MAGLHLDVVAEQLEREVVEVGGAVVALVDQRGGVAWPRAVAPFSRRLAYSILDSPCKTYDAAPEWLYGRWL